MTDLSKRKKTAEYSCGPLFVLIRENPLNPWQRSSSVAPRRHHRCGVHRHRLHHDDRRGHVRGHRRQDARRGHDPRLDLRPEDDLHHPQHSHEVDHHG